MQNFRCKVGVNARAYIDLEIEASDPDEALRKLREMLVDISEVSSTEIDVADDPEATVIQITDDDEVHHHELVDIEPLITG